MILLSCISCFLWPLRILLCYRKRRDIESRTSRTNLLSMFFSIWLNGWYLSISMASESNDHYELLGNSSGDDSKKDTGKIYDKLQSVYIFHFSSQVSCSSCFVIYFEKFLTSLLDDNKKSNGLTFRDLW